MRKLKILPKTMAMILLAVILVLFSAAEAQALMLKMSLDELAAEADSIVIGTVESVTGSWNKDFTGIYTTVIISVENELKSDKKQSKVTIIVPGGEANGITQLVSDTPAFEPGEQAVLFLSELPHNIMPRRQTQPKFYELAGSFQGKLDIENGRANGIPVNILEEELSAFIDDPMAEMALEQDEDEPELVGSYSFVPLGIKWPNSSIPVPYRVNATSARNTHVQAAANTWSSAGANFSFSYAGTHSRSGGASKNNINEIMWSSLGSNNALAVATIWYQGSTILETDMTFNTYYSWSTTGSYYDVQTVALHEFGHWLGLDHSPIYASIMYYSIKGTQRTLHSSDIDGIRYIYGTSSGGSNPEPAPPNDDFADRITINGQSGQVSESNINATRETGEPSHAGSSGERSLWWEWVAPANGSVEFNTNGSSFNPVIAVYTGSSLSGLSVIASDNGFGGTFKSKVIFNTVAGTSYKIAADSWTSGSAGSIVINWLLTPASCTVSAPEKPAGPDSGYTGTAYTYSVSGAACSNNHALQYRFAWGDGTGTSWSSSPSAVKSWNSPGAYQVLAQARCSVDTTKTSSLSPVKMVSITEEPVEFDLEISIEGEGTTSPATGNHTYLEGSSVTLSALSAEGWLFSEWDLDSVKHTNPSVNITMDRNIQAKAVFIEESDSGEGPGDLPAGTFNLAIDVQGEGATEPEAGSYDYAEGSEVNLTATASEGWEFKSWLVNAEEFFNDSITVTMNRDVYALAIFTEESATSPPLAYSLIIDIIGQGSTNPAAGNYTHDQGSPVNLTASAENGWAFEKWIINETEYTDQSVTITVNQNTHAYAIFREQQQTGESPPPVYQDPPPSGAPGPTAPVQYGLTIKINGEGSADPAPGSYKYEAEKVVSITAKPAAGWRFEKWVIDGATVTTINSSVKMSRDITATAYYLKNEPGDVTGDGSVTVLDVVAAARHTLGLAMLTESQLANADVNGDGVVDVRDITMIMQYALGLIDKFPDQ
jgi:hypothetical protein